MRKIISLALVAIMLLSTLALTSCDISSFIPSTTDNVRHTVYEGEWQLNLNATNFTTEQTVTLRDLDGNVIEQYLQKLMVREGSYLVLIDGEAVSYFKNDNGLVYSLIAEDGIWVEDDSEGEAWKQPKLTDAYPLDQIDFFGLFEYNEETKSYIYEKEGEKAEFYFENGLLVKGTIGSLLTISNIDRTSFVTPTVGSDNNDANGDFTPSTDNMTGGEEGDWNDDEFFYMTSFPPTNGSSVTEEEWNASMDETAFRAATFDLNYIDDTEYYYNRTDSIWCSDTFVAVNSQHFVKIGGFWYKISNTDGSYVAEILVDDWCHTYTIAEYLPLYDVDYSDVTYDEAKGCYVYYEEGTITSNYIEYPSTTTANIYFVDGVIQFVEYKYSWEAYTIDRRIKFGDVGTLTGEDAFYIATDKEPYEYTVKGNGNTVTAEKWNEILSDQLFTATTDGRYLYSREGIIMSYDCAMEYIFNDCTILEDSNNRKDYYVFENDGWYLIDADYYGNYSKKIYEEGFAKNVGDLLQYYNIANVDFDALTYNSELKAYEIECTDTFEGEEITVNALINYVDDSCIEVYISYELNDKTKYDAGSEYPVLKITINTEENQLITLPEYTIE